MEGGSASVTKSPQGAPQKDGAQEEEDEKVEEYEPDVDFKPVVTLPTDVEITTCEEDEVTLFGDRAKLYRHESGEWKERGVGEIKIMKSTNKTAFRIVMRREQVLKLCANHFISPHMKLQPLTNTDKTWCWTANDFSEGELKLECFALKFKTRDQAEQFKMVFEECQEKLRAVESDGMTSQETPSQGTPEQSKTTPTQATPIQAPPSQAPPTQTPPSAHPRVQSLAKQFQGSTDWQCEVCLVHNPQDKVRCLACESLKPGAVDDEPNDGASTSSSDSYVTCKTSSSGEFSFGGAGSETAVFGGTSGFGGSTTNKQPASSTSRTGLFGALGFGSALTMDKPANEKPSDKPTASGETKPASGGFTFGDSKNTGFTFGQSSVSSTTADKPEPAFSFSGQKANFTFNKANFSFSEVQPKDSTPSKPVFSFTEPKDTTPAKAAAPCETQSKPDSTTGFAFTFSGVTPVKSTKGAKSPTKTPQSPDDNGYYHDDDEGEHIYFEPIVKLPENVTVKTGEEEEDLLLCKRAKLFKFSANEWKERGVGDVKLLRDQESKRVRILMRRDQVLKICLNHYVTKDCELKPMKNTNGKAWVWYADDFTEEGEVEHSQFAIKFKTVEIADKFKASFDKAKTGEGEVIEAPTTPQIHTRSRKLTAESEARKSVSESEVTSSQKTPSFASFGSMTSTLSSGVFKFGASKSLSGTGLFGSQPTQPVGLCGSSPSAGG